MEKKYTDFMDEISSGELYEGLLAYGFFAERLPPVFTAVPFFNYCQTIPAPFDTGWNEYIAFRVTHSIGIPRLMGIPNPFKYQRVIKYATISTCRQMDRDIASVEFMFAKSTMKNAFLR